MITTKSGMVRIMNSYNVVVLGPFAQVVLLSLWKWMVNVRSPSIIASLA